MIPGSSNQLLGGTNSYQIQNSLRFRSGASASLSRNAVTPTLGTRCTFSGWHKRGQLGVFAPLLSADKGSSYDEFGFEANDTFFVYTTNGSLGAVSSSVFRDPSAWYHVVVAIDTTQATAANRVSVWINGIQQTLSGTYPNQNYVVSWQVNGISQLLCKRATAATHRDGYLADVYFIDGQALTPTSFGQFDANGVWTPRRYTGTYGTNGFYLPFNDGSNLTNLCLDRSGNSNNWTATNVSLTAGATYDWMVDTPTNNYAVLNPLKTGSTQTPSRANLTIVAGAAWGSSVATFGMTSGKWYWESTLDVGTNCLPGICKEAVNLAGAPGDDANGWVYQNDTGKKYTGAVATAYGATWTVGDVIGVAFDADAGTLTFYKNNASQGTAFSGLTSGPYFPVFATYSSTSSLNLGQRPFTYTPPSGFRALCTANLPSVGVANPRRHFDVVTRAGTGASATVSGLGFRPELLIGKCRNVATNFVVEDFVRGAGTALNTNTTGAEYTTGTAHLTSFNADGYTLQADNTSGDLNFSGRTYVDWLWRANGAPVTNNAGSITSQVSANQAAGFSIVTYTGTGANATVGHGLGRTPGLIILKPRSAPADNWPVWHSAFAVNEYAYLNLTNAKASLAAFQNSTLPSSTVFSLGTWANVNTNTQTYVAYCFAEIPGFSRFGSYTGNGSADGPFVFCGFRPRWVMFKLASGAGQHWQIMDAARPDNNVAGLELFANLSNAEQNAVTNNRPIDILANGFKIRGTDPNANTSTATYIFAAFAENPFGGVNVAPATAR